MMTKMTGAIEVPWLKYRRKALQVTRKTPPKREDFERVVLDMDLELDSGPFWRGDLMLWGAYWWGEDYITSLIDDGRGTAKTWANNFSVLRRLPPDGLNDDLAWDPEYRSRRHPALDYSHHAEVAYMASYLKAAWDHEPTDEQVHAHQSKYLGIAAEQNLTVRELRELIREDLGLDADEEEGEEVHFSEGTWIQKVERVDEKVRKLIDEAPSDWHEEAALLENARQSLTSALNSARNRQVGGAPQAMPESESESQDEAEPVAARS